MSQTIENSISSEDLVAAYRYDFSEELIAQTPAQPRDSSRLMVLGGDRVEHHTFRDLPDLLIPGDLLVLNDSRVIPARVCGKRVPGGGAAEILLLRPSGSARYDDAATRWIAMVRPGRKLRAGARISFGELGEALVADVRADGTREVEFAVATTFAAFLTQAGRLALPPYIHNDSDEAQERYQTVFAREPGSVAAPTASLHFTDALLEKIRARGVGLAYLALDIGLPTFAPMKTQRLAEHIMHSETFAIPAQTVAEVESARNEGRRVIAVGTTVLRALEGSIHEHGRLTAGADSTDLFIRPGFVFRTVDALITNFHLPQSTLLVLVCAFAKRERVLNAYREAIACKYRFYSFGDAMFVERTLRAASRHTQAQGKL
jgi:S-adenosylmethionine:tRNA ribosyltransferase-isomerase